MDEATLIEFAGRDTLSAPLTELLRQSCAGFVALSCGGRA